MNMECSPKNSPTYVASMCSERLKIKTTSASNSEYMVVFFMIKVMSSRCSFTMAIPTKAPKTAVASECITGTIQPLTIRVGKRNNTSKIREIIRKLIKIYSM